MDQYTYDLLCKWGLSEYTNTFADARIDVITLQLLGDTEIACLIGPIGDRLRFKSNLEIWKKELSSADSEAKLLSPLPENSSFVSNFNSPSPSVLTELQIPSLELGLSNKDTVSNNSVFQILNKNAEGRAILAKGRNIGLLTSDLRKQLSNILLKDILENDPSKGLLGPDLLKLAHEIHELFPQESPAIYYAPYLAQTRYQAKRNASGILFNVYTTRKRHLRNLGILPPPVRSRSHSCASTGSSTDNTSHELIVPATGILISQLQQSDQTESEENLIILESPDPGPWQDIERYWHSTVCSRLHYLYYEKGTLSDYFNRFPVLKSPCGFNLLLQDYEKLYPNNNTGMINLTNVCQIIIKTAKGKARATTDTTIKKTIQDYVDAIDENNQVDVCLLLLPYIINIPSVRRKGAWKPSRAEFRDGFIIKAATEAEVRPILAERRNKLAKLGVTFQPLAIYCGDTVHSIKKSYAVCDDILYEFHSLTRAVDVTFKIFHATGAQYPQESYDIWLLLQVAFYNLHTQFDRQSSSLKQVLVDLGLKDRIK